MGTTADFVSRFVPGGSEVYCIEPNPMPAEIFSQRQLPHRPQQLTIDVTKKNSKITKCVNNMIDLKFDLVYSLEVNIPLAIILFTMCVMCIGNGAH